MMHVQKNIKLESQVCDVSFFVKKPFSPQASPSENIFFSKKGTNICVQLPL
jgi:hypothetical protein